MLVTLLCEGAEDRSLSTPLLLHIVYSLLFRKSIYDIKEARARSSDARFFIDLRKTMQNINKLYQSHMATYILGDASPESLVLPKSLIINPQALELFKACTIVQAAFSLKEEILFTVFEGSFTNCFLTREDFQECLMSCVDNAKSFLERKNNAKKDFVQQYSMCIVL